MNYRRLGSAGLKVSELSYGAWVSFKTQMGGDTAYDCMVRQESNRQHGHHRRQPCEPGGRKYAGAGRC